jgi:hypothetical protein
MYESCEALSNWLPQDSLLQFPQARLYQGRIFEYFRWGHLGWLPATLVSREAVDRVGLFLEDYRTAADYIFLAALAKQYQTHMIAVPAAVKYEYRNDGTSLEEPHLATGINEYRYASKRIDLFRMLFPDTADGELKRIHGLYELYAGRVALRSGNRSSALQHFSIASECGVGNAAIHLTAKIAGWLPSDQLARYLYITLGHILSRLGIRI